MSGLLFEGGRIHVGDGTSAEALLARDGHVAAIGRRDEVRRAASGAEAVDLRGGVMVPGWFDAHVHFVWWAQQTARLDIADTGTLEDAPVADAVPLQLAQHLRSPVCRVHRHMMLRAACRGG